MNVLGVDLSLTGTGICHPDGSTETLRTKLRGLERLAWIRDEVWERVRPTDFVVFEGYSFNSRNGGEHLGELGGVVHLHLWESGTRFAVLPPASLKKYATGKGNAKKVDMAVAAMKRAEREFRDDNECDAWWLRQAGICWLAGDEPKHAHLPDDVTVPADYVRMPAANRAAMASMTELTFVAEQFAADELRAIAASGARYTDDWDNDA